MFMYILLMIILYANSFQLDDNCNVNYFKLISYSQHPTRE